MAARLRPVLGLSCCCAVPACQQVLCARSSISMSSFGSWPLLPEFRPLAQPSPLGSRQLPVSDTRVLLLSDEREG
eukprot:587099-Rhodomonas_salina.1